MIVLVFIIAVYVIQFLLGGIFLMAYFKKDEERVEDKISTISVIIPFKNETNRIGRLLQTIPSLVIPDQLKVEFLFVDDHSTDDTSNMVSNQNLMNITILKNKGAGKKHAIKTGVDAASSEYILTWDADILPKTNYFVEAACLGKADMWILPVQLGGSKLIQRLGAIEFSWLQVLGIGLAKYLNPVLCNGANLLFTRAAFLDVELHRKDYHIASGDDMFLLDALKKKEADIRASSHQDLMVEAESPATFSGLVLQRKRWAGKMNRLKSGFSIFFGLLLICFVFVGFTLLTMTELGWVVIIPVVMKIVNEYILLGLEQRGGGWLSNVLTVIIHQIWYPLYLIRLLFPIKAHDKRWA